MSRDAVKVWVNGQVVVSVAAGCTENVQEVTGEEGESPGWTGSLDLPAGWHTLKVLSSKHVGPDGLELRCLLLVLSSAADVWFLAGGRVLALESNLFLRAICSIRQLDPVW